MENLVSKEKAPATKTSGIDYIIDSVIKKLSAHNVYEQHLKILDVGVGDGYASLRFAKSGFDVTALGLNIDSYLEREKAEALGIVLHETDFDAFNTEESYDLIWASHVMEHVPNPGKFIEKAASLLKDGAILALSLPPYKPFVVGGHKVTSWTVGQLMYFLAHYEFDVLNGHFINYGYNVSAIVQKNTKVTKPALMHDNGDIEILVENRRLPEFFKQGIYGDFLSYNWVEELPMSIRISHFFKLIRGSIKARIKSFPQKFRSF